MIDFWADQSHGSSCVMLAMCYDNGFGVPVDFEQSFSYKLKAALLDDPHGMHNLALAYCHGRGVERELQKAFYWWEKSASLGNMESMHDLGYCYMNGNVVDKDVDKALELYTASAEMGFTMAMKKLVDYYSSVGDTASADYWSVRLSEAG